MNAGLKRGRWEMEVGTFQPGGRYSSRSSASTSPEEGVMGFGEEEGEGRVSLEVDGEGNDMKDMMNKRETKRNKRGKRRRNETVIVLTDGGCCLTSMLLYLGELHPGFLWATSWFFFFFSFMI